MSLILRLVLAPLLTLTLVGGPTAASDADWPDWSGPAGNRTSVGNDVFAVDEFGLASSWSASLGSGYAGIVIADGTTVTGFSDGTHDYYIAFDSASGAERWRYRIGPTYKGHDGSDDGPIATPALDGGLVFGLGPWGDLVALRLEDGSVVWKQQLATAFESHKPVYGFATSPVVVDGVLVVQVGGSDGRAIAGLDRETGAVRWSTQDDRVSYQSPVAFAVGDRSQVLAVTDHWLYGLEPGTGTVLWSYQHREGEDEDASHPVRVGEDGILLTYWPEAVLLRVTEGSDGYAIEEVWRSRALKSTYALPVYWEGHLYGYSGSILVCVDAATGEPVWKSRQPGDGNLILVDGHLVIQTGGGHVAVAVASPEGYVEKARTAALERGYLTAPSFAGGRIYTRNLDQIASLEITAAAASPITAPTATVPVLGELGGWVAELERSEAKQAMIDSFLSEHEQMPILEGDRLVHFVYRGDEPDLVLAGTFVPGGEELPLRRLEGTDLFVRSVEVEPASLFTYTYRVFDESRPDPLNPERVGPEGNEQSILGTRGWVEPRHLDEPTGPRGSLEELTWTSAILDNERVVKVYLPPGYAEGAERYPLLVVHLGDQALALGQMDRALDNLIGEQMEPVVVAFVGRLRWEEFAGSEPDRYVQALTEELIPRLESQYRLEADGASRGVMGVGSGAFVSMFATFTRPGLFGRVGTQSFYLGDRGDELLAAMDEADASGLRAFVQWSHNDYRDERAGLDAAAQSQQIVELMRQRGGEPMTLEVGDGPGWMEWSARWNKLLPSLYPAE